MVCHIFLATNTDFELEKISISPYRVQAVCNKICFMSISNTLEVIMSEIEIGD